MKITDRGDGQIRDKVVIRQDAPKTAILRYCDSQ